MRTGLCAAALIAGIAGTGLAAPFPPQNAERIREIAEMLPEAPGFPRERADCRELWGKCAARTGGYTSMQARELLRKPKTVIDESQYTNVVWAGSKLSREILQLATAECIDNKGEFLAAIAERIEDLCHAKTWMNPYHDRSFMNFRGLVRSIDLNGSETAMIIGMTLDRLRGKLPEKTVDLAMKTLRTFMVEPYLKTCRSGSPKNYWYHNYWWYSEANWNPACHMQCAYMALAVLPDRRERAEFIEMCERALPFYLDGFSKEGYCQEGMDYWNYGFGQFMKLCHIVRNATDGKVDLTRFEKVEACLRYAYEFQLTYGNTPQFGDGTASGCDGGILFMAEMFKPHLRSELTNKKEIYSMGYDWAPVIGQHPRAAAPRPPVGPYPYPPRTFFEDAQILICRPDASAAANALACCIKGGHNGVPHNHNDAGQFIISVDGVQVVSDPSGAKYNLNTFTSRRYESPMLNSYGHAVPYPAGTLQAGGKEYGAKVLKTEFSDERDAIVLDLTGAYTNANVTSVKRALVYDRAKAVVTIEDRVTFARPAAYESPVSTYGTVTRADENAFVLTRTDAGRNLTRSLNLKVDTHGAKWHVKEEKIPNPERTEPTRWAVVLDEPQKEVRVTFRFSNKDAQ